MKTVLNLLFREEKAKAGKVETMKTSQSKLDKLQDPGTSTLGIEKSSKKLGDKAKDTLNPVNSYKNDLEKIQEYDAGFKSIFEATKINDIDTLIEQFEKAENNNYSLLKYAESLSADIKELDEEIKTVEGEIEKYSEDGNTETENNRDKQFRRINEELEKTEKETKEYDKQYQDTVKTINQLKIGIKSIFDRIGCNNESVQEIIGTHGVTESNMMQYLGIIEQRTNEILQMYSACQVKGPFDSNNARDTKPVHAPSTEKIEIDPPNLDGYFDDKAEEINEVLSPEQLREKAELYIKDNLNKFIKKTKKNQK